MSIEWYKNKHAKPALCRMYLGIHLDDYEFLYWSDGWSVYKNDEWVPVPDHTVEFWANLNGPDE
jgi:hypothetical protein